MFKIIRQRGRQFIQSLTGAVYRLITDKLADSVSVFDFMTEAEKADVKAGTSLVNVATALQAALNAGVPLKAKPGIYFIGTTGVSIPASCRHFIMEPGAVIAYTGTGTAVLIDSHLQGFYRVRFRIAVKKTVADWDVATGTGTDVTSIGVKLRNCQQIDIEVSEAMNFFTGYQLLGDGNGCVHNRITFGYIGNNKIGVHHKILSAGWTNQNTYHDGQIRIEGTQTTRAVGSRYIQLDAGSDNMNLFVNTNIEGDMAERSLSIAGGTNFFNNLRYEANQAGAVVVSGNANMFVGAYLGTGIWSSILTDTGLNNLYLTGISGLQMDTGGATGLNFIRVTDGAGNNILNFRGDTRRLTVGKTGVSGSIETLSLTSGLTHLDVDVILRSILTGGFSIGPDATQMSISSNATVPYPFQFKDATNALTGVRYKGYVNTGRANNNRGANVAGANDLTLGTDGNYFMITGGGTINGIAIAGWSDGSEITLYFSSATTVKNNTAATGGFASMRLAGAADFAADGLDQLTLVYNNSTGYWVEKGRSVN